MEPTQSSPESMRGLGTAARTLFWTLLVLFSVLATWGLCTAEDKTLDDLSNETQVTEEAPELPYGAETN